MRADLITDSVSVTHGLTVASIYIEPNKVKKDEEIMMLYQGEVKRGNIFLEHFLVHNCSYVSLISFPFT